MKTYWRDMTLEEKRALILAESQGKIIECCDETSDWTVKFSDSWWSEWAYRVRPEPETVVLTGSLVCEKTYRFSDQPNERATHRLILTLIDGQVQPTAIVEEI